MKCDRICPGGIARLFCKGINCPFGYSSNDKDRLPNIKPITGIIPKSPVLTNSDSTQRRGPLKENSGNNQNQVK